MENTKEILEKEINKLESEISEQEQIFLNLKREFIQKQFEDYGFKDITRVEICDSNIGMWIKDLYHWEVIKIKRDYDWGNDHNKYKYHTLEWKNSNNATPKELEYIINVAKVAKDALEDNDIWKSFGKHMDDVVNFYKSEEIKSRIEKIHELKKSIKDLEENEKMKKFSKILDQKSISFKDKEEFSYGFSKYDYISSNKFEWEENPGGKTYKVFYYHKVRTNPYYDNGKEIEPIYETRKSEINKRIKKDVLMRFIKSNLNEVEE